MKIRHATPEDAPSVWDAHTRAIRVLCSFFYPPEQIEAWAGPHRPEHYLKPISDRHIFVADVAGRVVGFGEFRKEEIRAVYVHPSFARQGIGKALFQRVIEELRNRGVEKAYLDASLQSISFYTAMGCIPGTSQSHPLDSGIEIPCLSMTVEIKNVPLKI